MRLRVIDDLALGRMVGRAGRGRVETAFSEALMSPDVAKACRTPVGSRESS